MFKEVLCAQLANVDMNGSTQQEEDEEVVTVAPQVQEAAVERRPEGCFSVVDVGASAACGKATKGRRNCVLCLSRKVYKRTIYKCHSCDIPLCMVADRICLMEWHDLKRRQAL